MVDLSWSCVPPDGQHEGQHICMAVAQQRNATKVVQQLDQFTPFVLLEQHTSPALIWQVLTGEITNSYSATEARRDKGSRPLAHCFSKQNILSWCADGSAEWCLAPAKL